MTAATAFAAPGVVTAVAAAAIAVLMVGLWALSVRLRDVSIVDPPRGPGDSCVGWGLWPNVLRPGGTWWTFIGDGHDDPACGRLG